MILVFDDLSIINIEWSAIFLTQVDGIDALKAQSIDAVHSYYLGRKDIYFETKKGNGYKPVAPFFNQELGIRN